MVFAVETKILRRFGREFMIHTDCTHHRRNLANNIVYVCVCVWGGSTMGNGNFNLRRSEFRRMGNIRMNQSLIYKTMGKEHREFTVPIFLCNWMAHMPLFCVP